MNTENNNAAANPQSHKAVVSPAAWVEQQLLDLNNLFKKDVAADAADKEKGQKRLYQRLAEQWYVTEEILSNKDRLDAFTLDATRRGVPLPNENENLFLMFVRMYDGAFHTASTSVKDKQRAPEWKPNRSSEKHAGVLRWLSQNPDKIKVFKGNVAKLIELFDGGKGVGKKVGGIIAADRNANGKKRTVITAESFSQLRALPAIALLPEQATSGFTLSEGKVGLALVRLNEQDNVIGVIGDAKPSKADLQRYTKSYVERMSSDAELREQTAEAVEAKTREVAQQAASAVSERIARFGQPLSAA